MKKLLLFSGLALCLGITWSCSKNDTPIQDHTTILTDQKKAKLEAAADSVFMSVGTPGMIALISAEGEKDFIIRRGVANIVTGDPMEINNYYRIASVTKTFTGTAALILADEGKICLDSSISYYLPERNIPNGNLITIRMLGQMTSGLFNYTDEPYLWVALYESNFTRTFTADTLLDYSFRHPPNFDPGTGWEYCNTNTFLLGLLMEKVTGETAKQVIEEKVIRPLGLVHTYWPESGFLFSPYNHGYTNGYGQLMDATNWNPSWGFTAGALISTIPDMKIWAKALAEGKLLSDAMKTERFTWVNNHYGFCIMKAGNWVGHPGTMFGNNSHVFYNTSKKITLVILTNMDTGTPVEYFSDAFRKILDK